MMESFIDEGDDHWRWNLDTYARRISEGQWKTYRWQTHLVEKLIEAVLAGGKRIIVTVPPRHGKSETISRWLSTWYLDMFPDKRVILSSYSLPLARDWSEKVRDTFDGRCPEVWSSLDPDHATKEDWKLEQGGGMRAVGVGGSITGFGGDCVLIDDPHKDWAEVQSPTARKRVIDWFNGTLYHRLEPNGTVILVQTRWNEGDLAGYLLSDHEDDWVEIRLPALAEENDPLGRAEGEALCPERYDEEALQKIRRAVGAEVFAGLYQQRPAPVEGNIIKREWIQYYGGPTGFSIPAAGKQFQSWDLNAGEETVKGSYVVGQVWSKSTDAYLIDQVRERWDYVETKKQLKGLSKQYPRARKKCIEKKAAGTPIINELKKTMPGIVPVIPKGSKEARLQAVAPYFEDGAVWLPHPSIAPWVPSLVEELVTFPNAENDDQVDALSQALDYCKPGEVGKIIMNLDVGVGTPGWRL